MKRLRIGGLERQYGLLRKIVVISGFAIGFYLGNAIAVEPDSLATTLDLQQPALRLKWFFNEDPRSSGIKISARPGVVKISIAEGAKSIISRSGRLVRVGIMAKVETVDGCDFKDNEIVYLTLRLPGDYRYSSEDGASRTYDNDNLNAIKIGAKYYAVLDCSEHEYKYLNFFVD